MNYIVCRELEEEKIIRSLDQVKSKGCVWFSENGYNVLYFSFNNKVYKQQGFIRDDFASYSMLQEGQIFSSPKSFIISSFKQKIMFDGTFYPAVITNEYVNRLYCLYHPNDLNDCEEVIAKETTNAKSFSNKNS